MNKYDTRYMNLKIKKLEEIIKKEKTVVKVAEELNVSRQSVHKWLNRYKQYGIDGLTTKKNTGRKTAHNRTSPEVEQLVIQVADKYWNDGVETLHDHLKYENNIDLAPSTIYRILKRHKVRYVDGVYPQTRKKWKKKLYVHQVPGQELQMDTKYPFGYKQGKVIYTIIDDATRWVFAWSYRTANKENTVDFIKRVKQRSPFIIKKIRMDNGKEFTAKMVKEELISSNIEMRYNTPYCPKQNGKIERFHRTLNEKALRFGFYPRDSLDTLQYKLNLFLQYYNWKRKHRGLGMNGKTPFARLHELRSVNLTVGCYISCFSYNTIITMAVRLFWRSAIVCLLVKIYQLC